MRVSITSCQDGSSLLREAWQRVPEIVAAMGIREGSVVADVGAGYGFLTVRLAALVGEQGKVYAVDVVVILNAYHEMEPGVMMLRRIGDALKPGGRLVISEPWSPKRRQLSRAEQVKDHFISPELMVEDLVQAGFVVTQRIDEFTDFNGPNFLIVAERKR
jgi:predicted methyltransferase